MNWKSPKFNKETFKVNELCLLLSIRCGDIRTERIPTKNLGNVHRYTLGICEISACDSESKENLGGIRFVFSISFARSDSVYKIDSLFALTCSMFRCRLTVVHIIDRCCVYAVQFISSEVFIFFRFLSTFRTTLNPFRHIRIQFCWIMLFFHELLTSHTRCGVALQTAFNLIIMSSETL